ncbi:MAG: radical SAM protein [Planctomycetota bacterium]|jgi:7-carboxy-7-deazaguanine synthase
MPDDQLRVTEIFRSIQGESTRAGCPCVFVRLTGCHLRCTYCDTEYAFKEGTSRPIDEVVEAVLSLSEPGGVDLVEVTGGEPLLQPGAQALILRLCDLGKTVLVETSGACDISGCDPRSIRIMDLKTPGSGECDRNDFSNIEHLTPRDEIKFVITDRADYDWAKSIIERYRLGERCRAVLMSPVFEQPAGDEVTGCPGLDLRTLADWVLHDPPKTGGPVRLQTQLHKLIWEPQTRGV